MIYAAAAADRARTARFCSIEAMSALNDFEKAATPWSRSCCVMSSRETPVRASGEGNARANACPVVDGSAADR